MNPTVYPAIQTHPNSFYYQPENDRYYYMVDCQEIQHNDITYFLNKSLNNNKIQFHESEHVFFYYQQYDNRFYQVICKLVSPTEITNYLNENIYGIKLHQNMNQEQLSFFIEQKQNLEFYLTQYLSNYLLI